MDQAVGSFVLGATAAIATPWLAHLLAWIGWRLMRRRNRALAAMAIVLWLLILWPPVLTLQMLLLLGWWYGDWGLNLTYIATTGTVLLFSATGWVILLVTRRSGRRRQSSLWESPVSSEWIP
ncbi:hypothetical protein C5C31_13080 [Rathayibacter rathayi]|uniref:Integral membrane protein n=1 Tax=Rathayibacter rathayi TaxID=33887 RepID=A0ABX5AAZ8_RATRA|nr:hypothetical protein C5C34_10190 [Rathayibacter rathayi]PPF44735.1 hypothetical protein C5C08_12925 [Rathayibacter rathayi]PPF77376.1 hypothetical protein C5C14_12605 [Rathayibacter rathayi]PPG11464.1 hypothetical protein C5C11_12495 [Rathayibacter rathayi]PPG37641.1 hypothetical protein C5C20_13745 [Rathayibacter rathayi]